MKLDAAKRKAENILLELEPFCSRIHVAGSIRRQRPEVNDIDIVLVPKIGTLSMEAIIERCERSSVRLRGSALSQNITFRLPPADFQLDLFVAHDGEVDLLGKTPSNWGAVLLCRTGSMFHNQRLCSHAITKGLKFAPYKGVVKKKFNPDPDSTVEWEEIIASETEEDIYQALGLDFRAPTDRETLIEAASSPALTSAGDAND
jgi:DNA polymerase (family X)